MLCASIIARDKTGKKKTKINKNGEKRFYTFIDHRQNIVGQTTTEKKKKSKETNVLLCANIVVLVSKKRVSTIFRL